MTTLEAKEAQELTEKVLNVRFALEKLHTQKEWLESDVAKLQQTNDLLEKQNSDYKTQNDKFEKQLKEINEKIKEKQVELDSQEAVFKDEINKQFKEIESKTAELNKREKDLNGKASRIEKEKATVLDSGKAQEQTAIRLEAKEKELLLKEHDIKTKNDNLELFISTVNKKEDAVRERENKNVERENSLNKREQELLSKLEIIKKDQSNNDNIKRAIDIEREHLDKEKDRIQPMYNALKELQNRYISNNMKEISQKVIDTVIDRLYPVQEETTIITPTITEPTESTEEITEEETVVDTDKENTGETDEVLNDLTTMTQEELVAHAISLWIKAQSNRKKETIIKKIESL